LENPEETGRPTRATKGSEHTIRSVTGGGRSSVDKNKCAKKSEFTVLPADKGTLQQLQVACMHTAKKACQQAVKKDHYVIQAVEAVKAIEKAINPLVKKLREWYALYCPEAEETFSNHETFLERIKDSKENILEQLHMHESMGAHLRSIDLEPMNEYAKTIRGLYYQKAKIEEYIESIMQDIAPNLTAVAEPVLAAQLLSHAGSLERLAMMPSSTIQMLGAEDALFRFLKKQGRCPRHGVIVTHPLLASARNAVHGKIARKIAAAVSIAAKMDYFKGESFKGYELREKLNKDVQNITGAA
jgi:nucleolar protein 56